MVPTWLPVNPHCILKVLVKHKQLESRLLVVKHVTLFISMTWFCLGKEVTIYSDG